jgi:hypothetical protein
VVLICGRYEGVDERVGELLADEELSIGDYVLSGGELAAAVVLDATARLLPGVLGHADSSRYESFGLSDADLAGEFDCHPERSAQSGSPASSLAGVVQRAVEEPVLSLSKEPAYGLEPPTLYWKHIGLYAYRKAALNCFPTLPASRLERTERLEQLRFLENGFTIYVEPTDFDTIGVDTEADLRLVESILLRR